jgi:hypothetical protein
MTSEQGVGHKLGKAKTLEREGIFLGMAKGKRDGNRMADGWVAKIKYEMV